MIISCSLSYVSLFTFILSRHCLELWIYTDFLIVGQRFHDGEWRVPGQPYNGTENVGNQAMVWRVMLPSVQRGSVEQSLGI
jgi:hypothetical protein